MIVVTKLEAGPLGPRYRPGIDRVGLGVWHARLTFTHKQDAITYGRYVRHRYLEWMRIRETKGNKMSTRQYAVFDDCYRRMKASGWPKDAAAKAAQRYVMQMGLDQLTKESDRLLTTHPVV